MAHERLAEYISETSPIFEGLVFNDFILGAAKIGALDARNAARLLHAQLDGLFTDEVNELLHEHTEDYDGKPIDRRIVAPLLRDITDFSDIDEVWTQTNAAEKWKHVPITVLNDTSQTIVIGAHKPRIHTEIEPQSPYVFSVRDYAILSKPIEGRRPQGESLAHRFALGLSAYDTTIQNQSELSPVHRHFVFDFSSYPFRIKKPTSV